MTSQVVRSGKASPRMKPPVSGEYSSRRWIVLASRPQASARRRAARPVGAASVGLTPALDKRHQQRAQQRGLAGAGTAGDHGDLALQRASQRRALLGRELDTAGARRRFHRALDHRPAHRTAPTSAAASARRPRSRRRAGGAGRSRDCRRRRDPSATSSPAFDQFLDRPRRKLRVHLQRRRELMLQVTEGREDVALLGHPFEQKDDRGARALDRIFRDAEFFGDRVGGAKADASDGARQHVRIAAHRLQRVAPVHLVDAPGMAGGDPMAAQEDRELAQSRGIAPGDAAIRAATAAPRPRTSRRRSGVSSSTAGSASPKCSAIRRASAGPTPFISPAR